MLKKDVLYVADLLCNPRAACTRWANLHGKMSPIFHTLPELLPTGLWPAKIHGVWAWYRPRLSWRNLLWRPTKTKPSFKALVSLKDGFNKIVAKGGNDEMNLAKGVPTPYTTSDNILTTCINNIYPELLVLGSGLRS